jgi:hypothetical protein
MIMEAFTFPTRIFMVGMILGSAFGVFFAMCQMYGEKSDG